MDASKFGLEDVAHTTWYMCYEFTCTFYSWSITVELPASKDKGNQKGLNWFQKLDMCI